MGIIDRNSETAKNILQSSMELLVPGALRSLADRKVKFRLPIKINNHLINNPTMPYHGHYQDDEDTKRKPAYHNGTAWSWTFPSFSEAYFMVYGYSGQTTAKAILSSSAELFNSGCIMQLPEIVDGNYPHAQRGCDAQAWGITEFYRVWKLINSEQNFKPSFKTSKR